MDDRSPLSPALFVGHGSPNNALELNDFTQVWRDIGGALGRPRAVVVISAHWYFGATAVTAMRRPRTIHDFYGFPQALFDVDYPAPGDPDLAAEIAEQVKPDWMGLDRDQWGIDHGAWSVLVHLLPEADIPVLQISINALRPMEYHLQLARRLAPLRERGVVFLASGNIVHNLRCVDWSNADGGYDWAHRFDDAAAAQLAEAPGDILRLAEHPDYAMAVPTPEHFIPLLYLAGLAEAEGAAPQPLLRGYSLGSISMSSYGLGSDLPLCREGSEGAEIPAGVPPEQANI